jgi:hypothetical protein
LGKCVALHSVSFVVGYELKLCLNTAYTKLLAVEPIELVLLSAAIAIKMQSVLSLAIRIARVSPRRALYTIVLVSNHFSITPLFVKFGLF